MADRGNEDLNDVEQSDVNKDIASGSSCLELESIMKELIDTRRRYEAIEFAFQYAKAEKKEMLKMKDDKIFQLEAKNEKLTDTGNMQDWEIESLNDHIDELKRDVEILEEEKKRWENLSAGREKEELKLKSKLSALDKKLDKLEKHMKQKSIEKDDLQKLLDNQTRLFQEMQIKMDKKLDEHRAEVTDALNKHTPRTEKDSALNSNNLDHQNREIQMKPDEKVNEHKADLKKEIGIQLSKELKMHTKRVDKVIDEEMETVLNSIAQFKQEHSDGRSSTMSQRSPKDGRSAKTGFMRLDQKTHKE